MNTTSSRSEITSHGPQHHAVSSRTWQRTIAGRQYAFTAIVMGSGERRYAATVLRDGADPRFGCSWKPAGFWTVPVSAVDVLGDVASQDVTPRVFRDATFAAPDPGPELYAGESGNHVCPCCGDTTHADTRLCSECIAADCQPSTDAGGDTGYSNCERPPSVTYETIVFLQGDEASPVIDMLYGWQGDEWHCHYLGATTEGVDAALEYLRQWDYGDPGEERDTPSAGTSDARWELADGAYLLTANLGLGYVGLERVNSSV